MLALVVPVSDGSGDLVVGLGMRICLVKWDRVNEKASVEDLLSLKEEGDNRLNDGKADPKGRLLAGTMPLEDPTRPGEIPLNVANLYTIDEKGCRVALPKVWPFSDPSFFTLSIYHPFQVSLSNGLAWTSDNQVFYYIDSKADDVKGYDYDLATGALTNERIVFDSKANGIDPILDGMTIDSRGNLWIALFFGHKVVQSIQSRDQDDSICRSSKWSRRGTGGREPSWEESSFPSART